MKKKTLLWLPKVYIVFPLDIHHNGFHFETECLIHLISFSSEKEINVFLFLVLIITLWIFFLKYIVTKTTNWSDEDINLLHILVNTIKYKKSIITGSTSLKKIIDRIFLISSSIRPQAILLTKMKNAQLKFYYYFCSCYNEHESRETSFT